MLIPSYIKKIINVIQKSSRASQIKLENDFIPYTVTNAPKGNILIMAPHHDDETLGMAGTILLMKKQGANITIVVVTDGSKGGNSSTREKEFKCAAEFLGVKSFYFWNIPDREVVTHEKFFKKRLSQLLINEFDIIFLPSFQEFHPDHRYVTYYAIDLLKRNRPQQIIWLYEISRQSESNTLIDISKVIIEKEMAIKCYKSQLSCNDYLAIALSINKARALSLVEMHIKYAEGFFRGKAKDISKNYKKTLDNYFN